MTVALRLQVSEDDADAERLGELTGFLRNELLQLDVEDVTALRGGEPPPGSRAFEVLATDGLLVTLGRSADALQSVVSAITAWLRRGRQGREVRLELGGDVLELSDATEADQRRLIELFISRNTGGENKL